MAVAEHAPPIPVRVPREHPGRRPWRWRLNAITVEAFAVFAVTFAGYMLLGRRIVLDQHLIVFDATARLAHAYFVFWNAPPKLASIGFVWAPVSTLVFLPFALLKPLATSLMALPATSGFFAAMLMALLGRAGYRLGMPRWQRLTIVAAFAVSPMVLFYAVNGMSEMPYLALLTLSLVFLLRWYRSEDAYWLVPCGLAMTFAVLSRYEVMGYAIMLVAIVGGTLMSRRRSQDEVEGSILGYLAPIFYGVGLWVFFNWLILGDPLFWLRQQIGIGGGASDPLAPASALGGAAPGRVSLLGDLAHVNVILFPLVVAVVPALLVTWVLSLRGGRLVSRKDGLMSFWMACLVSVNAATTALLILKSPDSNLLQLRYNMRAMPVAVLGLMWLWHAAGGRRARLAVWAAGMVLLVGGIGLTWHAMRTWPIQYEENVFARALSTGKDQEGTDPGGPYTIGNADDREMADWITDNTVHTRDGILTDDGQTFGVILATGHPEWFLDRIDKGDATWKRTLAKPWGKVNYMLAARYPLPPDGIVDEVQKRYPGLRSQEVPGLSVEHANRHYVLLRVAPKAPTAPPSRFDDAFDRDKNVSVPRL